MYYGEKVVLREMREEDVEVAMKNFHDYEVVSNLMTRTPFPLTFIDEKKFYESITAFDDKYNFAIADKETGKYIGGCGINHLDYKNSNATIGIALSDKNYWSKGYGTDAMKVLVSFIFKEMNINKVKLNVFGFNHRAKRCYEKVGFKLEGTFVNELYRDGKYHDVHAMAIFRDEFLADK